MSCGTRRFFQRLAAGLLLVLAASGCDSATSPDTSSKFDVSDVSLAGTWTSDGTVTRMVKSPATRIELQAARLVLTIQPHSKISRDTINVAGTWSLKFANPANNRSGTLSLKASRGQQCSSSLIGGTITITCRSSDPWVNSVHGIVLRSTDACSTLYQPDHYVMPDASTMMFNTLHTGGDGQITDTTCGTNDDHLNGSFTLLKQSTPETLAPVASVSVSPATVSIADGATQLFTATTKDANGATLAGRTVTWTSSHTDIATVNSATGMATGVTVGVATIKATSEGKDGVATLTVFQIPVATVTVLPAAASVAVGAWQQFDATLKDASGKALTGRAVTWSSGTPSVATINAATGLATAVASGTTTITATSGGKSGTAMLTVSSGGVGLACSGTPRLGCGLTIDQFALIPAGTFQMGSTQGYPNEMPVHAVTISRAFYLQKTEVTQGQWLAVMGSPASAFSACGATCPVEQVSWDNIQVFLQTLNARTPGVTYRLPTEAEWEYAARAGSSGGTGETYGALDAIAWYTSNASSSTHPAAGKLANAWGLYDMFGNASEWVSDWFGVYSSASATDPMGPATGTYRVQRGGSWSDTYNAVRAGYRASSFPSAVRYTNGFRLVRTP